MRFYKTRRLRIISVASLLLVLTGLPLAIGLIRPSDGQIVDTPGVVAAYAGGLSHLGIAGLVSLAFAVLFGYWLLAGKRHEVGLKYLAHSARRHHNLIEGARALAIIFGTAGLIVGSLAGLYAALMHARPDLASQFALPFMSAQLALGCLLGGGALYAAGRIGRTY